MNGDALEIINVLNTRMDSLRVELANEISESRKELLSNLTNLEQRLSEKIQYDQKDHKIIKRALMGMAALITLTIGTSPGGVKLIALVERLL